jgi:HEAT repeat protein
LSAVRERRQVDLLERWTERWIGAVFLHQPVPQPPLSREALDAALDLRELLKGDEGEALAAILEQVGVAHGFIRQIGSRRLASRLEALDGLAKGRFREAFHPLLELLADEEGVVRLMAGRALARILANWAKGPELAYATSEFTEAMRRTTLPAGAAGEILLLLEDAARPILATLLTTTGDRPRILRAALDATGRLGLSQLKGKVGQSITHPDPEVRAAALRALSRLGKFPRNRADDLVVALDDQTEFVRVQAARAAIGLPQRLVVPLLYETMGDRSWWVRRASAESLLRLGTGGRAALRRAAEGHPDRFARDMSAQVLSDAGEAMEPMPLEMTA